VGRVRQGTVGPLGAGDSPDAGGAAAQCHGERHRLDKRLPSAYSQLLRRHELASLAARSKATVAGRLIQGAYPKRAQVRVPPLEDFQNKNNL